MSTSQNTQKFDYRLIDSGDFNKLEQVGPYTFVRPSPQAVWKPKLPKETWQKVDAVFERFSGGDGKWTINNKSLPKRWTITQGPIQLTVGLTDFGHLGIFPEQDYNWIQLKSLIESSEARPLKVLNLFAYTGGASLACAAGGAEVVHVDASKTSVQWARDNAQASNLANAPIRWIVEDVQKFVERELRRGSRYHGFILDPPSFGRGTNNEVWQIEDHLVPLLQKLKLIADPSLAFVLLSSHSHGYTPIALTNLIGSTFAGFQGNFLAREMVIKELHEDAKGNMLLERQLPSGASSLFYSGKKID